MLGKDWLRLLSYDELDTLTPGRRRTRLGVELGFTVCTILRIANTEEEELG